MRILPAYSLVGILTLVLSVFAASLIFNVGYLSIFYVCAVLFAFLSDENKVIISSTIISLIFILSTFIIVIDIITVEAFIYMIGSVIITLLTSVLAVNRNASDIKLKRSKETLELRVLARTAESESRIRFLEQQIIILQNIKNEKIETSFNKLDDVISNLRKISSELERDR